MNTQFEINKLLEKIERFKKEHKLDLSSDEDLSIAIMNLVSLEEHFFFSGAKTDKEKYYDLLGEVREIRKELLKKIVKDAEGEVWCISKHLLAASMRLIEVGTKELTKGDKKEAENLFTKAYNLYSLLWRTNLPIGEREEDKKNNTRQTNKDKVNEDGLTKRLEKLVQDLINCCEE